MKGSSLPSYACPHGNIFHCIRTSSGTVSLCRKCHDAMMSRLADRDFLVGMMRAAMPGDEYQRMLREREAMRAEL